MPKPIRNLLNHFSNSAADADGAMKRNLAQALFEPGERGRSLGALSADAASAQVVNNAMLAARDSSLVGADAGFHGDPTALRGMARLPAGSVPPVAPNDVLP